MLRFGIEALGGLRSFVEGADFNGSFVHAHLKLRFLNALVGEVDNVVFEAQLITQEFSLRESHYAHRIGEHQGGEAALQGLYSKNIVAVLAEDAVGGVDGQYVGVLPCELEVLQVQLVTGEGTFGNLSLRSFEVELYISEFVHGKYFEGIICILEEEVLNSALKQSDEIVFSPLYPKDGAVGGYYC